MLGRQWQEDFQARARKEDRRLHIVSLVVSVTAGLVVGGLFYILFGPM